MIKNLLESVCYRLPDVVQNGCVKLVNEFAPEIMRLIATTADPDMVCTKIQMCDAKRRILAPPPSSMLNYPPPERIGLVVSHVGVRPRGHDSGECATCEYVIRKLDEMIEDKHNEEEIREGLEKICGFLPRQWRTTCKKYIDQYTDEIIDAFARGLTPQEVIVFSLLFWLCCTPVFTC